MTSKPRGFAVMPPAQVRALAALGGRAAHAQGAAHEWTPQEAQVAGQRGGRVTAAQRRARAEAEEAALAEVERDLQAFAQRRGITYAALLDLIEQYGRTRADWRVMPPGRGDDTC